MKDRIVLVVGDKFSQFAVGKNVITLTQLRGLLSLPESLIPEHGRLIILPGQGLGDDDVAAMLALAATSPRREQFDLTEWYKLPKRAAIGQSNKHRPENTLISEPRLVSQDVYEVDLLVDEDCELMGDHQTGQHLQGMVLMEAARQTFIAVTKSFYMPKDKQYYFIVHELSGNYHNFAFPLDARMRYFLRDKDSSQANRSRFVVDIIVEQCGKEAASFHSSFTAFDSARVSAHEALLARKALDNHLAARLGRLSEGERLPAVA